MKFRQRAILKPENLLFGAARLDERPGAEGAFIAKEESGVTAAKYLPAEYSRWALPSFP